MMSEMQFLPRNKMIEFINEWKESTGITDRDRELEQEHLISINGSKEKITEELVELGDVVHEIFEAYSMDLEEKSDEQLEEAYFQVECFTKALEVYNSEEPGDFRQVLESVVNSRRTFMSRIQIKKINEEIEDDDQSEESKETDNDSCTSGSSDTETDSCCSDSECDAISDGPVKLGLTANQKSYLCSFLTVYTIFTVVLSVFLEIYYETLSSLGKKIFSFYN